MKKLKLAASILLNIILLPVFAAVFFAMLVVWVVLTCTLIGPLLQWRYNKKDTEILESASSTHRGIRFVTVPGSVNSATSGISYRMAVRFTAPIDQEPKAYICIPNGLGATIVILSKMQDQLVDRGFAILTFDRLGVGFSDDNPTGKSPSAADIIRECNFAMNSVAPVNTKWIMIGPSMGSTIAQCYIASYPEKVIGFLNLDGLPYPFAKERRHFELAGKLYRIYPWIIWTGILRPFIGMAVMKSSKVFTSKSFDASVAKAQLNQSRFFSNIATEMKTMMDCCDMAARAWGPVNILDLESSLKDVCLILNSATITSSSHHRF